MHDKHCIEDLLHGQERRVYGDSAYASQKALIKAHAPQAKDFTHQRTRRAHAGCRRCATSVAGARRAPQRARCRWWRS